MTKRKITLYIDHEWGFLIPCESGFIWDHQTGGCCCHHPQMEGVFIPLEYPFWIKDNKYYNFLSKFRDYYGYMYAENEVQRKIWKDIKKEMDFDFEIIKPPKGKPVNEEGWWWIKLTKFKHSSYEDMKQLIGKKMVLIYPNSD